MIPYEELVVALQSWRAKQGLPVGQLSGSLTPPPPAVMVAPPQAQPRPGPPVAPPKMGSTGPQQAFLGNVATPPPLASPEESMDVDESALIEEAHFDSEGDDFAVPFGAGARPPLEDHESTSIGEAPDDRPTQANLDDGGAPASGRTRNDDW